MPNVVKKDPRYESLIDYRFNLQLFQGEKTEKATPKKRKEARDKGQVVQTKDINSALTLFGVFLFFQLFSDFYIQSFYRLFKDSMTFAGQFGETMSQRSLYSLSNYVILESLKLMVPILLVGMILGLVTNVMQVGFLFTVEPLQPKLDKINPLKGFKRMFSLKSLVEMIKSLVKGLGALYITYAYIKDHVDDLYLAMNLPPIQIGALIWNILYNVVIRNALLLFAIGVFDYVYKLWENDRDLKMSKQEIKDEYKLMEGDPMIKSRIRDKQRQFAMSRMMQDVPKADVIITNPTHFAVAIQYDAKLGQAPKVLAKGQDLIAQSIKRVATESSVPIVENKQLAQTLYKSVDIGSFIPSDLYEAVAEVLAYVYSIKKT
jgi:flagellar biosynthetic protein FlhB